MGRVLLRTVGSETLCETSSTSLVIGELRKIISQYGLKFEKTDNYKVYSRNTGERVDTKNICKRIENRIGYMLNFPSGTHRGIKNAVSNYIVRSRANEKARAASEPPVVAKETLEEKMAKMKASTDFLEIRLEYYKKAKANEEALEEKMAKMKASIEEVKANEKALVEKMAKMKASIEEVKDTPARSVTVTMTLPHATVVAITKLRRIRSGRVRKVRQR